jgi:carbon starvation protein
LICTLTAGYQKIFHDNPKIGFLAHANKYNAAALEGNVLAPAKSSAQMQQIIFNDYLDASLAAIFMAVVLSILFFGISACIRALREQHPSSVESEIVRADAARA